ncbi:MAG: ABC transporter ATP-binding protein, partial [Mesorhizobium sp.]|nr:ABC transporter ATP-binding protein [Mesorhizobium sp.]
MSGEILMRATGLGKAYPRRENPFAHMRGLLFASAMKQGSWALQDVGLSLARGEALGVVGRNGAGKSTLLQILCGTQTPSTGSVESTGRIAAMLELGAGFNPEFTGRENVSLNASIYGLSDRQIAERYPRIAAFADIGEFIDRPVEEYSSGMRARLAFAICAHVDADILVIDEVLGVGDAAFQAKCRAFMEDFLRRGAVIFVSHDDQAVLSVCNRAMWLEKGRLVATGPADTVMRQYREAMAGADGQPVRSVPAEPRLDHIEDSAPEVEDGRVGANPIQVSPFLPHAPLHGHGGAVIDDTYFSDADGRRLDRLEGGRTVVLNI